MSQQSEKLFVFDCLFDMVILHGKDLFRQMDLKILSTVLCTLILIRIMMKCFSTKTFPRRLFTLFATNLQ